MQNQPYEIAIQRLEEAKTAEPELVDYYEFYQKVFRLQGKAKAHINAEVTMIDEDVLISRAQEGLPQLSFTQLPIDLERFRHLAISILHAVMEFQDIEISDEIIEGTDWVRLAMDRFYEAPKEDLPEPAAFAAFLATTPYLEWATELMMPHLAKLSENKRRCPVCGGEPSFSYLEKEDGRRWLYCPRCRAGWAYIRMGCPFCGNNEPEKLRYYPAGKNKAYRLYVCDDCNRYLKAVDLRKVGHKTALMAENVLTWSLDKAAEGMGYN